MRYSVTINNNYIVAIGTGEGGQEITKTEYTKILRVIRNRPQSTETKGYRLKTDLTWEEYEFQP